LFAPFAAAVLFYFFFSKVLRKKVSNPELAAVIASRS